jgi:hypothetical protein
MTINTVGPATLMIAAVIMFIAGFLMARFSSDYPPISLDPSWGVCVGTGGVDRGDSTMAECLKFGGRWAKWSYPERRSPSSRG